MPLTCPRPESSAPDCPLYGQRVVNAPAEALRRAVLTERNRTPDLAGLIRAEQDSPDPVPPGLPPGSESGLLSIFDQQQGEPDEQSASTSHRR
jgi:hypothetical protein